MPELCDNSVTEKSVSRRVRSSRSAEVCELGFRGIRDLSGSRLTRCPRTPLPIVAMQHRKVAMTHLVGDVVPVGALVQEARGKCVPALIELAMPHPSRFRITGQFRRLKLCEL